MTVPRPLVFLSAATLAVAVAYAANSPPPEPYVEAPSSLHLVQVHDAVGLHTAKPPCYCEVLDPNELLAPEDRADDPEYEWTDEE